MKQRTLVMVFGLIFLFCPSSRATDDAAINENAKAQTQQLLTDPAARNKAIGKDPKAQQADQFIKNLTGNDPGLTEEVYALAADVFSNVVKDCHGDVTKMKAAMEKFMKNPEEFAATWTDAQKTKLKDLEDKIHMNPTKK